jgi:hypothetical protein
VITLALGGVPAGKWVVRHVAEPTEEQKAAYTAWIGQPWP